MLTAVYTATLGHVRAGLANRFPRRVPHLRACSQIISVGHRGLLEIEWQAAPGDPRNRPMTSAESGQPDWKYKKGSPHHFHAERRRVSRRTSRSRNSLNDLSTDKVHPTLTRNTRGAYKIDVFCGETDT